MAESTGIQLDSRPEVASDLELLRRFEPVVAYTEGEMFFPMAVDGYVRHCSLWRRGETASEEIVPTGKLGLDDLARFGRDESSLLSLRFVREPLSAHSYRQWAAGRPKFAAQGRLARVGLAARFVNAFFYLSLLMRGRVPGGTTGAAQQQYRAIQVVEPGFVYHGRVAHEQGYTVLNYQFFHAMNDWRSSFFGVNDHEADWEQVFVYLVSNGYRDPEPAWVAYASHDFEGDDLRRRWDDPDLIRVGQHPVVYAGAGSHSSYFKPGEYVISVDLKLLRPLARVSDIAARFWRVTLGQGDPKELAKGVASLISVPFVDYARGDGLVVGPGQDREWSPVLIDDTIPWVGDFRGLWGLDTRDPFAGELAPAGPMYNRNGSVRETWFDPVGWAGLSKEPLPDERESRLVGRINEIRLELIETEREAAAIRDQLPQLKLEAEALGGFGSWARIRKEREEEIARLEKSLRSLMAKGEDLAMALEACERHRERIRAGFVEAPQAHIKHRVEPVSAQYFRNGRLAELWAAASTGLLLLLAIGLIAAGVHELSAVVIAIVGAVLVDNILRGSVVPLLLNVTILLAIATAVVLIYVFFWQLALVLIGAIAVVILVANLRELRAH